MSDEPNAASLALIIDDCVLLICRAYPPAQNLWTLPGGRRKRDETIENCILREIKEELGLSVGNLLSIGVETFGKDHEWRLAVFASADFSGTPNPSDEIAAWQWVRLPEIGSLNRTARLDDVLARAFAATAGNR